MTRTRIDEELDEEMIGLVAARHGIVLDRQDPAAVIPTLVQLGIERGLKRAEADQVAGRDDMRALVGETHAAAVGAIEKELVSIVGRTRDEMRRELDGASASAATLVANIRHAHSRPVRLYWLTFGLVAAIVLVGMGFAAGMYIATH